MLGQTWNVPLTYIASQSKSKQKSLPRWHIHPITSQINLSRLTVDNNVSPKKQYATNVVRKVTIKAAVKPESALER